MDLLQKFENLPGLQLDLTDKYVKALNAFAKEIELVGGVYEKDKMNPEIPRNMSPIAGRISWIRQLFARVELPMRAFSKKPSILKVRFLKACFVHRYVCLKAQSTD